MIALSFLIGGVVIIVAPSTFDVVFGIGVVVNVALALAVGALLAADHRSGDIVVFSLAGVAMVLLGTGFLLAGPLGLILVFDPLSWSIGVVGMSVLMTLGAAPVWAMYAGEAACECRRRRQHRRINPQVRRVWPPEVQWA